MKRTTVYEYWREFKTQKKPKYVKMQGGKRKKELMYELALIFPNNRWAKDIWVKDSLGRNQEAIIEDKKYGETIIDVLESIEDFTVRVERCYLSLYLSR